MSDEFRSSEPHDRLTRICDRMLTALLDDPEYQQGDAMILLLDSHVEERGGMTIHGHTDREAVEHLFMHLRAIFRVNGSELLLAPLGRDN